MKRATRLKKIAAAILSASAAVAVAQSYPSKPVKVIVPYPAGVGTDVAGRIAAERLSIDLGQPFVVENRAGASTTIGTVAVATAPPDGYTLLVHTSSFTTLPALLTGLRYDTSADFSGISILVENPLILVASKAVGANSVRELIAKGKAQPGKLSFGTSGAGTISHLGAEKFRIAAGFEALHVPFKGTDDAVREMMAGRVDFGVTTIGATLAGMQEGKLVALAMLSQRSATLPNVVTMTEAGVPQGSYRSWIGLLAPSKTPAGVVQTLNQAVQKGMADPGVKDRLLKVGLEPSTSTPAEFDALIKRELVENGQLVKTLGIKPQ